MQKQGRRLSTLPDIDTTDISYTLKAIERSRLSLHSKKGSLKIDGGYGDYNMMLFRKKDKLKYLRDIPSAFTPDIKGRLEYQTQNERERRLMSEHNQRIGTILRTPKEEYITSLRKEEEDRRRQKMKRQQYVKGELSLLKGQDQHLGFRYVTNHQADHWFTVKDNSDQYQLPPISDPQPLKLSKVIKRRKNKGFIFVSDDPKQAHLVKK